MERIYFFDLKDLGIIQKGIWMHGCPQGWSINNNSFVNEVPLWMREQPAIEIKDNGVVYVRGLFNSALTEECRLSLI